ncbi:BREX-4 system phosphatase PglZ [Dehalobacter sp. 4CP]|uniref:BREX-4 system phosphatase PglZ n=1 Tax=Dehalobacter sp. CP TaxID=2594474 RepID=UPI0039E94123
MNEVTKYLSNTSVNAPFFLVVGDGNYESIKTQLSEAGLKSVKVSELCRNTDKRPNLDSLIGNVDFADIDGQSPDKKIVILGLGEYLALCGEEAAFDRLSKIKDMKVGNARVVILLRGVTSVVLRLQNADPTRFDGRRVLFTDDTSSALSVAFIPSNLNLHAIEGIKALLDEFECGKTKIRAKSNVIFDCPMFVVSKINSAYDAIKHIHPTFSIAKIFGTDEQWTEFLSSLNAANGEINALIEEFGDNPENVFSAWINGVGYKNWLYFITLKLKLSEISNSYLKYVIETTTLFADFKRNIINAIINVPHTDRRFDTFYNERKVLVEKFAESDIAAFVSENRRDLTESIYKLTDRTLTEREEFIALFSSVDKETLLKRAEIVYSALVDYLRKYIFVDPKVNGELNTLLTEYFESYKSQKISNAIKDDFLTQVETLAIERKYNSLRTRSEVLTALNLNDTYLYWIDALSVEFLSYIQKLCENKGLSLRIHIAQAELPTITSMNNEFYFEWRGQKEKEQRLDELKHKESGGYIHQPGNPPIHLAKELDIISEVLEKAATKLALHHCKKVLIASDHGASRLAVINEQEEKYDTDTKGEHSGRCRKKPADYSPTLYDLPFATESPDGQFLVLANYGRFKGSRRANVEVHGGASLEEVVIPIIEITLANPDTSVEVVDNDRLIASFRKPLEFMLFSKTELQRVSVVIKGILTPFVAKKIDKNHYRIRTEIKRPGKYLADVFDSDNLIGKINLDVLSETQKKSGDDDFDSMF